jgi:2-hydroxychromene-2-carboxylate isomerase
MTNKSSIEFYIDFSSPYAYLASRRINAIGEKHGRAVAWKPILLGAVFKITGAKPLVDAPMKGDYSRHDMERSARRLGLPLNWPSTFPFNSIAAGRAFYWLDATDPAKAVPFAQAVYAAAFDRAQDVSGAAAVAEIAGGVGVSGEALLAAIAQPEWKDRLRIETDRAIELGVFGAPTMIVDGEKFWGADRLDHLDEWIERGGW